MQKKKPPHQGGKKAGRNQKEKQGSMEPAFTKIVKELTPAIDAYLEKSAAHQQQKVTADQKIADSISKLTSHLLSDTTKIQLNFSTTAIRKKSRKSKDSHHQKVRDIILKMRKRLKTYEEIAQFLEKENIPTFSKRGKWHAQTVHRLFQDYPES